MIDIKNLNIFIHHKKVIHDLDFKVLKPSIIGLLGPNGAGKSTLLNTICGLPQYKKTGNIILFKKEISKWSMEDLAKRRAMLAQKYDLPFPFKVKEIIAMGLYPYNFGDTSAKDLSKINQIMNDFNIYEMRDKFYSDLSGGQKQRVSIARVLLQATYDTKDEKLVLLDEPTSNLDWKYQIEVAKIAKQLVDKNCYVFISLHDVNLALRFCDSLLILKNGKKVSHLDLSKGFSKESFEKAYGLDLTLIYGLKQEAIIQPTWC